jgi:phenylacetate-CoA ligase
MRLDEAGISPSDIHSIDDLYKLPFTVKNDLRDNYPYGLFAVEPRELVRVHASSGTTGKQTVVGYTAYDIDVWAQCAARAISAAGGTKDDFIHVSYGYGLFTGGLGLHYGAEKLGATAIPVSSGNTKRQVQILQDFGSDFLCCTPSYAMFIGETVRDMGIDPKTLKLRGGIFGAEPWTDNMRREIEKLLDIKAYDIYGLSEITGPGVSYDCECQNGLHICEDYFYPEVIDPDTGALLPDGEYGELVFTCIGKEALPLIRYRTRDICALNREPCSCGRTFVRMTKPHGRSDDMLIIRGVNVFPSQVEHVLLDLRMNPNYLIIVDRVNNLDSMEVQVEMNTAMFSDTVKDIENTEKRIENALQSTLNVHAKVRLVEPGTLPRSEGKAKRVIDKRNI